MKIVAEDQIVQNRVAEAIEEWDRSKPIQGSLKAETAMNSINMFEANINRLRDDSDMVFRAKEALSLETSREERLDPVIEEIRDLKAVWTALSGVWSQISEMRDTPWSTLQPRKLRQQIDGLLSSTREMPSRMRQYAAFEYVQETLRQHLKSNPLVSDLKSEALRERHWRLLFKRLQKTTPYIASQMKVGSVWDLDLRRNELPIKEIITQAQGEMALEEYLKQVKETWSNYTLDLVNYQNKTRLIRGWDDLFNKCSENLNSLVAMKMSPFYKVFEEEASSWEDKLNRTHVLFDVWVDVQRQWVYLEFVLLSQTNGSYSQLIFARVSRGIFSGSADIKHLLPMESSRFANIQSEFLTVMKKVFKSPFVLDVLNIPGIQKSLERLAEMLNRVQKALGEYLERERASFPRFYFVGDEDLLEIIGNSKDILRILRHLKKMFAGISSLTLDEEVTQISGMTSAEGEEVAFDKPVSIKDHPKINDWLALLEQEMKNSLGVHLINAHTSFNALLQEDASSLSTASLLDWVKAYPAQIVVVALQVEFTNQTEIALEAGHVPDSALALSLRCLDIFADAVLTDLPALERRKVEHLITELVHHRDVIRHLVTSNVKNSKAFEWMRQMRFYRNRSASKPCDCVEVVMSDAAFLYGFEYLGVADRLVQTPLTDRCYFTLTQALKDRLGGSPFGPAGTGVFFGLNFALPSRLINIPYPGKTESVKALGSTLGRFVLVFCCDDAFDFQAMGRIFTGLCQVGAWGA